MKKLILITGIVSFPAIASASYLLENYNMTLNPIVRMNLLGVGLFVAAKALRQLVNAK